MRRMPSGSKSKQEAARQARLEREAAERAAAERKKRLGILGGALVVVVVIVGIVLAAGVFKSDPAENASKTNGVSGVNETRELLAGVPVKGTVIGNPNAPVTILELADLKCPACKAHQLGDQIEVVKQLVRTGKANLDLRLVNIIDPGMGTTDGERARRVADNLIASNKYWPFVNVSYYNQGDEREEWATAEELQKLATSVGAGTINERETPATRKSEADAQRLFEGLQAQGTPSSYVKPRGTNAYTPVNSDIGSLTSAVETAAKQAK